MIKETLHEQAPSKDDHLTQQTLIVAACKAGDTKVVQRLVETEFTLIEINDEISKFQPLHYAIREGHADVVKLLLEAGAAPNVREPMAPFRLTVLDLARMRGFDEVVTLVETAISAQHHAVMLETDAPIRSALEVGDLESIEALVRKDPSLVTAIDQKRNTPFHRASESKINHAVLELIDFLIDHQADVNAANHSGLKPVDLAIFHNGAPEWALAGYLPTRGATYTMNIAAAMGDLEAASSIVVVGDDRLALADADAGELADVAGVDRLDSPALTTVGCVAQPTTLAIPVGYVGNISRIERDRSVVAAIEVADQQTTLNLALAVDAVVSERDRIATAASYEQGGRVPLLVCQPGISVAIERHVQVETAVVVRCRGGIGCGLADGLVAALAAGQDERTGE